MRSRRGRQSARWGGHDPASRHVERCSGAKQAPDTDGAAGADETPIEEGSYRATVGQDGRSSAGRSTVGSGSCRHTADRRCPAGRDHPRRLCAVGAGRLGRRQDSAEEDAECGLARCGEAPDVPARAIEGRADVRRAHRGGYCPDASDHDEAGDKSRSSLSRLRSPHHRRRGPGRVGESLLGTP